MQLFSPTDRVEIYAHRGCRALLPENTLPAFDHAIKVGVDFLDLDVVVTADNILVASHDLWLNPDIIMYQGRFIQQSESKLVKDLTFAELQQYTVGMNQLSNYAKYFPQQKAVPHTRIPSVQQVIDYTRSIATDNGLKTLGIKYQIEIKNDPVHPSYTLAADDLAQLVYELLVKNNLIECVEIQAFDWQILFTLQQLDMRIKTAYLVSANDILRMHYDDLQLANLYHAGYLLRDYNYQLPRMVKSLGGACYEPEDVALTKADLSLAHDLGLKVVVWRYPEMSGSIFDSELASRLLKWGVDGLIVDDPHVLKQYSGINIG